MVGASLLLGCRHRDDVAPPTGGALSGTFLLLATASPLLLDISRMARGYGLAFLAMSVLVVAALEAESTGRR